MSADARIKEGLPILLASFLPAICPKRVIHDPPG